MSEIDDLEEISSGFRVEPNERVRKPSFKYRKAAAAWTERVQVGRLKARSWLPPGSRGKRKITLAKVTLPE